VASYAKRPGGCRAQVAVQGARESNVLLTNAEAIASATAREAEIRAERLWEFKLAREFGKRSIAMKRSIKHKAWAPLRKSYAGGDRQVGNRLGAEHLQ
jgi:hypothetical protein